MHQRKGFTWILALILLLAGCLQGTGSQSMSPAQIHEYWAQMSSYQATVLVTFHSNKGSNTYTVQQQVMSSGQYRMEVMAPEECKGVVTICDGTTTIQEDPSIGMRVTATETPVRGALFLFDFWQQYLQGASGYIQGGVLSVSAAPEYSDVEAPDKEKPSEEEYMLEARLKGTHEKLVVQRLWVSSDNGYPLRMVVYDIQGKPSIEMEFLDFQPNAVLDPSLFTVGKE